jgi:hypothetical protein
MHRQLKEIYSTERAQKVPECLCTPTDTSAAVLLPSCLALAIVLYYINSAQESAALGQACSRSWPQAQELACGASCF